LLAIQPAYGSSLDILLTRFVHSCSANAVYWLGLPTFRWLSPVETLLKYPPNPRWLSLSKPKE